MLGSRLNSSSRTEEVQLFNGPSGGGQLRGRHNEIKLLLVSLGNTPRSQQLGVRLGIKKTWIVDLVTDFKSKLWSLFINAELHCFVVL